MNTTARADESDGGADAIADDGTATADERSINTTARADESDGGANAIARRRERPR